MYFLTKKNYFLLLIAAVFAICLNIHANAAEDNKRDFLKEANKWSDYIKRKSKEESVELYVDFLREALSEGKLSINDVEITEKEIKEHLKEGYFNEAKKWIDIARERVKKEGVRAEIEYVYEMVQKGGYTLADIGTTEEEMKKLIKREY